MNLRRPHCGKPAMTVSKNIRLGAARSTPCQACGRQVGVSWLSALVVLPLPLYLIALPFVEGSAHLILFMAFLLAEVLAFLLTSFLLPPRPRGGHA